jgi:hypothetical protein
MHFPRLLYWKGDLFWAPEHLITVIAAVFSGFKEYSKKYYGHTEQLG